MSAVVGLDTASNRYHWVSSEGLYDGSGDEWEPAHYGWVGHVGPSEASTRHVLYLCAHSFFRGLPPGSRVFCESPLVLPKNIETTRKLNMAAAVIELAFYSAKPDATWFWVDPQTWKKAVFGRAVPPKEFEAPKSKRTKEWIRECATAEIGAWGQGVDWYNELLGAASQQSDLFDAWGLMRYGQQQS